VTGQSLETGTQTVSLGIHHLSLHYLAATSATKLYVLGSNQNAGTNFRAFVEKEHMNLGYPGTKSIQKIVPRISGTGSIDFYVGQEMMPHEGTTWKGPYTFTSGVHSEIPVRATGNYLGIRAESTDETHGH
jgi:hypothetical protein